jgi:hypothetical protein
LPPSHSLSTLSLVLLFLSSYTFFRLILPILSLIFLLLLLSSINFCLDREVSPHNKDIPTSMTWIANLELFLGLDLLLRPWSTSYIANIWTNSYVNAEVCDAFRKERRHRNVQR